MRYYVIVYDRKAGMTRSVRAHDDRWAALSDRFEIERSGNHDPTVEVAVLGAQSKEALHRTHARYFQSAGDLVDSWQARVSPVE
jgi:hypothetical protein